MIRIGRSNRYKWVNVLDEQVLNSCFSQTIVHQYISSPGTIANSIKQLIFLQIQQRRTFTRLYDICDPYGCKNNVQMKNMFIPPQTVFVGRHTVFTLSVRPSIRPSVRPSVTFCFLNIFKGNGRNFIKSCKHNHIYRANNYNKK